jgi:hypothetical protein
VPAQFWEALVNTPGPWQTASGGPSSSTSSPGTVISPTTPDFTFPANWFYPGAVLRITAWGQGHTGGTTTNGTFAVYWGGTGGTQLLLSAATQIGAASATATVPWNITGNIQCRTVGSSGTVFPYMMLNMANAAAPTATSSNASNIAPLSAPATVSIDTTTAKSLVLSAWLSGSTGSPTITCDLFQIESMN